QRWKLAFAFRERGLLRCSPNLARTHLHGMIAVAVEKRKLIAAPCSPDQALTKYVRFLLVLSRNNSNQLPFLQERLEIVSKWRCSPLSFSPRLSPWPRFHPHMSRPPS